MIGGDVSLCCIGNIGFCESFVRSVKGAFCCEPDDSCCELTGRVTLAALTCLGVGFVWHVGVGLSNTCLSVDHKIGLIPQDYELGGAYDVRVLGGGLFLYRENYNADRTDGLSLSLTTERCGRFTIGNGTADGYRGNLISTDLYKRILFLNAERAIAFLKDEPLVWECGGSVASAPCYSLSKNGDLFIQWPRSEGYPEGRILRKGSNEGFPEILTLEDLEREYSEKGSPVLKILIELWTQKIR